MDEGAGGKTAYLTYIETADICKDEKGEYIFSHYLDDKLHFGPEGYKILGARVKEVLDNL